METKHTPGPWHYTSDVFGMAYYIQTAYDTHKSFIGEAGGGQQRLCEIEANAKLIAAAPEMLEMLQEFADMQSTSIEHQELRVRAINLILKATL